MEMLLLLLVPLAITGLIFGGDDDDSDRSEDTDVELQNGTADDDLMRGDSGPDIMNGDEGDDLIFGYQGDDTLSGDDDNDVLLGGDGDDVLLGNKGFDILLGGAGNDVLAGGPDGDLLVGGAGADTLEGGAGDDILLDLSGANQLFGGAGDDILVSVGPIAGVDFSGIAGIVDQEIDAIGDDLYGEAFRDSDTDDIINEFLSADADPSADALYGGGGSDALFGDNADTLTGGNGNDAFGVLWMPGNDPVELTDYETAREEIVIVVEDQALGAMALSFQDSTDGAAAEILLGGEVVATLTGVLATDLDRSLISVEVQSFDALMSAIQL